MKIAHLIATAASWALAAAAIAATGAPAVGDLDSPLREWRSGPVKYLLTGKEGREYRKLTTDEERLAFIGRFWDRRNPTPETPENELREVFWRRVLEANRFFVETTKPGWKTDRGRIYILLGPPDERELDPLPKGGRGEIRWIYRSSPFRGTGPNQIIAFRQDRSGEYRISTDPRDYQLVFSFVTRTDLQLPPVLQAFQLLRPVAGVTRTQLMLDLGRLERPPGEEELLTSVITAQDRLDSLPLRTRFDFYRAVGGATFVAINLGVERSFLPDGAGEESLLPVARLESVEVPGIVFDFVYRNPFAPAPDNDSISPDGYLIFQAGQGIPPGRYRTFVGLFDQNSGEVASRHGEVTVPSFPEDVLSLSSLTLARQAEPAGPEASGGPYKRPFILAGRRIVPAIDDAFRNGETFSLYFQIYGARRNPLGRHDLAVEYLISVVEEDGPVPLGPAILAGPVTEQVVGWSWPLRGWPPATYQLRVTVTDHVAGESVSQELRFTVDG